MPYVKQEQRQELDKGRPARSKGELNYIVTREALRFIDMQVNGYGAKAGYDTLSAAIGALRDAADELARRLLGPREDIAIRENGDMYPVWLLEAVGAPLWEPMRPLPGIGYVPDLSGPQPKPHPGYIEDKLRHTSSGWPARESLEGVTDEE